MAMTPEQYRAAQRQSDAYDAAVAAEDKRKSESVRILSGEQYAAEDALAALKDKMGDNADLDALKKSAQDLQGKFTWFGDVGDFLSEIDKEAERRRIAGETTYGATDPYGK